jgi:RNA polymerase sigma-70 factor (ECF subfamily)
LSPRSSGQGQRRRAARGFDEQIHRRLVDRDPIAPSELADTYLPLLIERLKKKFKSVAEHEVMDAAADAILNYAEHPERFKPARLDLEGYVMMSAQGDLLNALARHRRHREGPLECPACGEGQLAKLPGVCPACGIAIPRGSEATERREIHFEAVAEGEVARNTWREPNPGEAVEQSERVRGATDLRGRILETFTDPRDRQLVRLILDGERKTAAYSAILGVQSLDILEQRRLVKQHKDRVTQRLRRLGAKLRE